MKTYSTVVNRSKERIQDLPRLVAWLRGVCRLGARLKFRFLIGTQAVTT